MWQKTQIQEAEKNIKEDNPKEIYAKIHYTQTSKKLSQRKKS